MRKASTRLPEQGTQTPSPAPDLIPAEPKNQPRTHIAIGPANGGTSPATIVIYNPSFLLSHHTEPHAIKAAMYGFDQLVLGLSPIHMRRKPRLLDRKSGPGRKMGSQFNTTISAVSVINGEGLIIYHNVFAAIPLKVEVFSQIAVRQFMLGKKQPGEFETWQEVSPPNAS